MADTDKQEMVIVVGVDSDEAQAGFGVIRQDAFEEHDGDLFALLYGGNEKCDTFDTWQAAVQHVEECDGRIVDVFGAIAY